MVESGRLTTHGRASLLAAGGCVLLPAGYVFHYSVGLQKWLRQGKQGRLYYGTQVSSQPPTFVLFVNDPDLFKDNYRRYLERQFRAQLEFTGTPIRILWRGKSEREAQRSLDRSQRSPIPSA